MQGPSTYPGSDHGVVVFTDGSCPGQNLGPNHERFSGCGVWFGHNDPRNLGIPNPFPPHTNNRAEMAAVILALQQSRRGDVGDCARQTTVTVMTDSSYVERGMKEWLPGWKRSGFRRTEGGVEVAVKNSDLWLLLDSEQRKIGQVHVNYVAGHRGIQGNEEADRLARVGAQKCREGALEGRTGSSRLDTAQGEEEDGMSPPHSDHAFAVNSIETSLEAAAADDRARIPSSLLESESDASSSSSSLSPR